MGSRCFSTAWALVFLESALDAAAEITLADVGRGDGAAGAAPFPPGLAAGADTAARAVLLREGAGDEETALALVAALGLPFFGCAAEMNGGAPTTLRWPFPRRWLAKCMTDAPGPTRMDYMRDRAS